MVTRKSKATKEHKIYVQRAGPERVAKIMRERGVSEADAKKIARGHKPGPRGTPEHGKVYPQPNVAGRDVYGTNSGQAANRIIAQAARNNQRVSVTITSPDGERHSVWVNPGRSAGAGISAKFLQEEIRASGGNFKAYMAGVQFSDYDETLESGRAYELGGEKARFELVPYSPESVRDIAFIEVTVYHR